MQIRCLLRLVGRGLRLVQPAHQRPAVDGQREFAADHRHPRQTALRPHAVRGPTLWGESVHPVDRGQVPRTLVRGAHRRPEVRDQGPRHPLPALYGHPMTFGHASRRSVWGLEEEDDVESSEDI